jgi:pimeloyl-ACP methyl ester carboxylesterase
MNFSNLNAKGEIEMEEVKSADGTRIVYDVAGDGPALVLVDGALSTRKSNSRPEFVGLLAPHLRVYSYDRRGRGDSGDTLPYSVEREIEDVEALIELAGGTASLYGHSSGGCLSLEAACTLGDKVEKVVVYEAPYDDDPDVDRGWRDYLNRLSDALAAGRGGDAVALFMQYLGTPAQQVQALRQSPAWPGLEAIAHTLAYDHAGIIGPSRAVPLDRLAKMQAPTLAVYGTSSPPFMEQAARAVSEAVPNGKLVAVAGQAHQVDPAVLAPLLIEFLAASPSR